MSVSTNNLCSGLHSYHSYLHEKVTLETKQGEVWGGVGVGIKNIAPQNSDCTNSSSEKMEDGPSHAL